MKDQCPKCMTPLLGPNSPSDEPFDVCLSCGGVWSNTSQTFLSSPLEEKTVTSYECPKCEGNIKLMQGLAHEKNILLDECPNCKGLWFDRGELKKIDSVKASQISALNKIKAPLGKKAGEHLWYVYTGKNNKPLGPFVTSVIHSMIKENKISSNNYLYCKGMEKWRKCIGIKDFSSHFKASLLEKPANGMVCQFCQTENELESKFCKNCGKTLGNLCPKCNQTNSIDSRFCSKCGLDLKQRKESMSKIPIYKVKPVVNGSLVFISILPLLLFFMVWGTGFFGGFGTFIFNGLLGLPTKYSFMFSGFIFCFIIPIFSVYFLTKNLRETEYTFDENGINYYDRFFSMGRKRIEYDKIIEVTLREGYFERQYGLGSIIIHTAGISQNRAGGINLAYLKDPQTVYRKILEYKERYGKTYITTIK